MRRALLVAGFFAAAGCQCVGLGAQDCFDGEPCPWLDVRRDGGADAGALDGGADEDAGVDAGVRADGGLPDGGVVEDGGTEDAGSQQGQLVMALPPTFDAPDAGACIPVRVLVLVDGGFGPMPVSRPLTFSWARGGVARPATVCPSTDTHGVVAEVFGQLTLKAAGPGYAPTSATLRVTTRCDAFSASMLSCHTGVVRTTLPSLGEVACTFPSGVSFSGSACPGCQLASGATAARLSIEPDSSGSPAVLELEGTRCDIVPL